MIALLSESMEAARFRLREIDRAATFNGVRATLSDGRRVVVVLPNASHQLHGIVLSGFWIEGRAPADLVEIAKTRVRPNAQRMEQRGG